ncbi:MAG: glycosyltransferase [Cyanobacteria bacterium P01_B01_bin.77]
MKILYLYSEVMGYTVATLKALTQLQAFVHVVHWDEYKLTPYQCEASTNIHFYPRSKYSVQEIEHLADSISPDITVVSGWLDKGYLSLAKKLRRAKKKVVVALDGQWFGTARQYLASTLASLGYFTNFFSHAWVAGTYQYEYARRLGFSKESIIYNLYSADIELFCQAAASNQANQETYPHRFLYVGRLEAVKNVELLIKAWQCIKGANKDWELHLIGNGSLSSLIEKDSDIVVKNFMQPHALVQEAKNAGCFILPSIYEPWGVVLHEFAAAGLPLICSTACGSAKSFLIHNYNGYLFDPTDIDDLADKMLKIINSNDLSLYSMGEKSSQLSKKISPHTSAANLVSISS